MRKVLLGCLAAASLELAFLGCTSDPASPDAEPKDIDAATSSSDTGSGQDGSSTNDSGTPSDTGSNLLPATFKYTPGWTGVTKVEVIGGFGQASDWTTPIATLTSDGAGSFSGTANLPAGQYLYLFKVTGDDDAKNGTSYTRYAIDPTNSAYQACPDASPTGDGDAANPCAQLTVPQSAPPSLFHVRGTVARGAAHAKDYLVVLERVEDDSHHFFANRMTLGNGGQFDLLAAAGSYRIQVLHPTFYKQTDAQRDPNTADAMRRLTSGSVDVSGDVSLDGADVAYDSYAAMTPQSDAAVPNPPTTFHFALVPGAVGARLAIYGPATTIGDPWYVSGLTDAGTMSFDGGFNTKKAKDAGIGDGITYWWGTEQQFPKTDASVGWTGQSMVFPVTFE